MAQRTGLGKGLDALIPGGSDQQKSTAGTGNATQVSLVAVSRNPRQPRVHFDSQKLKELTESIREHGVIQPLIVSPNKDGTYTLIAGERRLEASRKAGLETVPVVIRQASDREMLELALIENVQRDDLNPLEEADAYQQLVEDFNLSHDEIAKRVGKSRSAITNTLRLLNLKAPQSRQALVDGQISEGHARALLGLASPDAQDAALQTIINLELSVRQTEALVRKLGGEKLAAKRKVSTSPDVSDIERRLRESLGTKVSLRHGSKGGSMTIHYYSDEELDALLERLLNE
ncbi:MAG: ParB/RepB/Spo0J family partition protein [Anaerolineales bacterium]|nr:ParB/RepB/Spo0J family partition protein [Anaerolineales bacterium]